MSRSSGRNGFSPWASSELLGGAGQRIAVAAAASAALWLAVLWSSMGTPPPGQSAFVAETTPGLGSSATGSPAIGNAAPAATAIPSPPPPPSVRMLAAAGTPAPGGGSFDRFGIDPLAATTPVNARGDAAFFAKLMRSTADEALFLVHDGRASLVASVGSAAPGGGSITSFTEHPTPALNDAGIVAFAATIEGGRADQAVLSWSGGRLASVAQSGARAPGVAGGAFFDFGQPSINAGGDIAFLATVRRGRETLDAIYLAGRGSLAKIAAAGDPAPGGGTFSALAPPTLNAGRAVAFAAVIEGGQTPGGVFVATDGAMRRVVGAGDPVPGGGMFMRLSERVGLDDAGHVAFGAFLGQGAPKAGVFLAKDTVVAVAMLGAEAPGGGRFGSFGDVPALAADGRLAFMAAIDGGPGTSAAFGYGPEGLSRLAGVGDPVADGRRIAYLPLNPVIAAGPGGRVTFQAGVRTGEETTDAIVVYSPPK